MLRRKNLLDSGTRDKPGEKGLVMNTVTLNAYPRPSQCPQVFSERGKMRQIGRVRWGWRNTLFEGVCLFYPDMFLHPVHLGVGLLEEAFDFLAKYCLQNIQSRDQTVTFSPVIETSRLWCATRSRAGNSSEIEDMYLIKVSSGVDGETSD